VCDFSDRVVNVGVTSGRGGQTEVNVFVSVPESGVEPSELHEHIPTDRQTSAGDGGNFDRFGTPVAVKIERFPSRRIVKVDTNPGGLISGPTGRSVSGRHNQRWNAQGV